MHFCASSDLSLCTIIPFLYFGDHPQDAGGGSSTPDPPQMANATSQQHMVALVFNYSVKAWWIMICLYSFPKSGGDGKLMLHESNWTLGLPGIKGNELL